MKLRFLTIALILISFISNAQYGNEWIDYTQSYYKIKITEDGFYRLYYDSIVANGIDVSGVSPENLQLFGKEKQQPIRLELNGDNNFGPGDYLEFFAEGNDGWLDSLLYDEPNDIANPDYSLYNDTLVYFLSWNTIGGNKRYVVESDVNFDAHLPAPYFLSIVTADYNSAYHVGKSIAGSYSSFFDSGEGWGTWASNGGGTTAGYTFSFNVNTSNRYTGPGAPLTKFQGKSVSSSDAEFTGTGNHHLRWEIGNSAYQLYDEVFTGYRSTNTTESFNTNLLNNGNTPLKFHIVNDQGALTDYQAVNYWSVLYPKIPSLAGETLSEFRIDNAASGKIRIDFTGVSMINPRCYVTDGGQDYEVPMVQNGSIWQVLIPNATTALTQTVKVVSESVIQNVSVLEPVNGSGLFTDFTAFGVEEAYILVYPKLLSTAASEYANYRSSNDGGSHNVILTEIEDLCMQFGGGVPKHVMGIRRFSEMLHETATLKPVGLMLLGKGVREATEPNTSTGLGSRKSAWSYGLNLIPSFGYPSSDVSITSRLNGSDSWAPLIPTGRIAVTTNEQAISYLDKVKQYELAQNQTDIYSKPNKEWQKQVLHFGGGSDTGEQNLFKAYLSNMEGTIEGPDYGGNVTSFYKSTSDPIDPVALGTVNGNLEDGVSLMTFFGHGTADGFDQNIDDPSNWNNMGKYPVVLGNACYTGDIFRPNTSSISEEFVLEPQAGAIGFLSSTKLGFASYLYIYSSEIYRQFSPTSYALTIGEQQKRAIENVEVNGNNFILETTCQQMTFHGDPVIKLNWHAKPEIDLQIEDVYFTPEDLSLEIDSIDVNVVLTNLGKAIKDTFSLEVRRDFPLSVVDSLYIRGIEGLNYKDTIVFRIPLQPNIGVGINNFNIKVDIPSEVEENYEEITNNEINKTFFVNIGGIIPVEPYDYAVVPNKEVTVKASTVNPIAGYDVYRFEIDTTDLFNSPEHRYALVQGLGGVKEVPFDAWLNVNSNTIDPLICGDSVAYFWRVAVDSTVPQWIERSFQYIEDKVGWGQDHFFQFKNGNFSGVEYNRDIRKRQFGPVTKDISAEVYDHASNFYSYNFTMWKCNGGLAEYGMCTTAPSLHLVVIDPATLAAWETQYQGNADGHYLGNVNHEGSCRPRPEKYFIFRQNAEGLAAFDNAITNLVPDGYYYIVYTARHALYDQWDALYPQLYTTFANELYSDSIYPGRTNNAFIHIGRKGDPDFVSETVAQEDLEFIVLEKEISGFDFIGNEKSTLIGPAANWNTVYWKQDADELVGGDTTRLRIYGYDENGSQELTIDTLFSNNDSINNFNNIVDAADYPYLKLEAFYIDSATFTPAQIDRWHVLYDPLPEAAIDGTDGYVWLPGQDTLNEGEEITFAIDVKNIFTLDMDSLKVDYWIEDNDRVRHDIPYDRQDSLRVPDVLRDTITFNTIGYGGNNSLWMEVNPYVNGSLFLKDQPEQAHFNNLLEKSFFVIGDDVNPILDVTFDGVHILDGDIVNPNTEILITLLDDNEFLVMDSPEDTARFGIYLTSPDGIQEQLRFTPSNNDPYLVFEPATTSNLKFKIIYPAAFTQSGEYELLVQGSDRSNNLSGDIQYKIRFEVILESSITYMMNYPNPFSTSTRFVFTLTGTEVPDEIKIQIMTISGRVVREITEDELGPLQIGRNITDYEWNGTDEYGDPLANGVYLYRVIAQIDGKDIDHRASGADKGFKKNFGKMYIIR